MTLPAQCLIGVMTASGIARVFTVLPATAPDEMRGRVMVVQLTGFGRILGGYVAQTLAKVHAVLLGDIAPMGLKLMANVGSKSIRQIGWFSVQSELSCVVFAVVSFQHDALTSESLSLNRHGGVQRGFPPVGRGLGDVPPGTIAP